jgi:hypothetical protein
VEGADRGTSGIHPKRFSDRVTIQSKTNVYPRRLLDGRACGLGFTFMQKVPALV